MGRIIVVITLLFSVTVCSSAKCGSIYERGVSNADAQIIVNKHNALRQRIMNGDVPGQPKGVGLKTLKWDSNLAVQAQKISDTCTFAHVPVTDPRWPAVGQNLAISFNSANGNGAGWDGSIQSWFNEYKNYHYPDDSGSNTGHYTQVVWAKTEYVGCGYTHYYGSTYPNMPYEKLYVCNYGPAGNYRGEAPYPKA